MALAEYSIDQGMESPLAKASIDSRKLIAHAGSIISPVWAMYNESRRLRPDEGVEGSDSAATKNQFGRRECSSRSTNWEIGRRGRSTVLKSKVKVQQLIQWRFYG